MGENPALYLDELARDLGRLDEITFIRSSSLDRGTDIVEVVGLVKIKVYLV